MRRVYFDNAATSWPKAPGLPDAVRDYLERLCVNTSRTYSLAAQKEDDEIFTLREDLAAFFHASKCIPVFSPSLTEALNTLIAGHVGAGGHVIVSGYEHNAVMRCLRLHGIAYDVIEGDGKGGTRWELFSTHVRKETRLVIVNAASNVSGIVAELDKASECAHRHQLPLIVDTAQACPFTDIDFDTLDLSAIAFTAHKGFLGPEGLGGFIAREDYAEGLRPLVAGGTGSQSDSLDMPSKAPERFEAGTLNTPALAGFALSIALWKKDGVILRERERMAAERLYSILSSQKGLTVTGENREGHCPLYSVTCSTLDNAALCLELSRRSGIESRVGLHCAPLAHMSLGTYPTGTLRFSAGPYTSDEDFEILETTLKEVLK